VKVLLFGATGMVGQGVLRECLLDPGVESVISVVRRPAEAGNLAAQDNPKLRQLVLHDFYNLAPIASELTGIDACYYCIGVTSMGMGEAEYRRISYDMTMTAAELLVRQNPAMTFIYVSASGADPTEHGRVMWARVRGALENALLRLPFRQLFIFRLALIEPLHGIKSRTAAYRWGYILLGPVIPLLRRMLPRYATTTEQIGKAMLALTRNGYSKHVLEVEDINSL
jgi:uncharacterized protein YbjT (DUF2867 family)